jgi:hypothetical protein
VHAPVTAQALQELGVWLGYSLVAITIASSFDKGDLARLGQAVIVATLFYNCAALLAPILGMLLGGHAVDIVDVSLGYDNQRFLNHVQTVALPLAAAALHQQRDSRAWLVAGWAALLGGFCLLYLTGGRGTFVGLLAAALLSPLWLGRSTWPCIRPLALSALGGFALFHLLFEQLPDALDLMPAQNLAERAGASGSVSARLLLWVVAKGYIIESPWLGIGPMHFAHWPNWEAAHPHNVFLQIGAEWGLPMLALLVVGVAAGMVRLTQAVRLASHDDKLVGGLLMIACVAVLVDGCVSGNFVMPVSQMWIAVCAGATAHWLRHTHSSPSTTPLTRSGGEVLTARLMAAVLVATQVLQLALMANDLASIEEILQKASALSGNNHFSPRFWVNGWF